MGASGSRAGWRAAVWSSLARSCLRRAPHGADDVLIAGAPAQVAFEPVPYLLIGRVWVVLQQVSRRQDHPRGAVTALQRVLFLERLLQWVPLAIGEPLDRGDIGTVGLDCQD